MMDAPRYRITSLADFLAVPPDRLPACLVEFGVAIEMWRAMEAAGVGKAGGWFTWIDDGDGEITMRFRSADCDLLDVSLGNWRSGECEHCGGDGVSCCPSCYDNAPGEQS